MTYGAGTPPAINVMTQPYRGVGIAIAASDTIQLDRYTSATGLGTTAIPYGSAGTEGIGWYLSNITNNATYSITNA